MKTTQVGLRPTLFVIVAAFLLNAAITAKAVLIGYWRMESQMTTTATCFSGTKGVADSATAAGQGTLLGSCTGVGATDDPLITFNGNGDNVSISATVPPSSMFNTGFSGGVGSYNAEAIASVDGALFYAQDRYGDEFSTASWTFEMFIKANGNQSGGGFMQLVKNDENNWNYGLVLNESSAGGLRLFIYDGSSFPTLDLTDRNYADGQWHYIVCSYDTTINKLTIRVRSENGLVSKNYKILSVDPVAGAAGNLFLGRNTFNNSDRRTFRGLMDEVRISSHIVSDDALEGKINPDGTNAVAYWRFENILTTGSATNFARFQDSAIVTNQGTGLGSGGATAAQDYLNMFPGDTGVVLSNSVPPASLFRAGFTGGTNSMYCQTSTSTASFDPGRFGDELNGQSWTWEMFYKANGNQAGADNSEANRMQLLRNGAYYYGAVANEASAGSLRLFAQQTDGVFRFADLTDRNYSDGTWQYLVCTYHQPSKKLTLRVRSENGLVSSNSFTLTLDLKTTPETLSIGAVDSGGTRRVRGWIDEVRFSDGVQPDGALMAYIGADSTNAVSSSGNPTNYGSSITFTSGVSAVAAGNGTPTGTVQFKTNGVAMGGAVTLVSGVATISTALLPVGSTTVTAEYAGDGKFYGSTNTITQTVNQALVTVASGLTANDKVYDGTPTASINSNNVTLNGVIAGETANVSLSTNGYTATFANASAGNGKSVNVSGLTLTGSKSGNYTLTQPTLTANITQAGSSTAVASSINPSGYLDPIELVATVISGVGTPTGNVQFKTNGTAYGDSIALAGDGKATNITATLPRGTFTITADYLGDNNYSGSTGTLVPDQTITNHPPVANVTNVFRGIGTSVKIDVADLLTSRTSDVDGDARLLQAVAVPTAPTEGSVSIITNSGVPIKILYTPTDVTNGNNDSFNYEVADGFGGTATGTVNIIAVHSTGQATGITNAAGTVLVDFAGIPNYAYEIQRATNVDFVTGTILTVPTNAPANGAFQYADDFSDIGGPPAEAYYRLRVP